MPVFSFFKYTKDKRIGRRVSLERLASEHKRKFNRNPIIVVDGSRIVNACFGNLLDRSIYGGQWSKYLQIIRRFVQRIKALDFVFYFDGSSKELSNYKMSSKQTHISEMTEVFQKVRSGNYHHDERSERLPTGIFSFFRYMLKYEFGCTVRNAMTDLRQEMARFASTNPDCVGILAADADFVIFDTKPLLSTKDLDIENMTTEMLRRSDFIDSTDLSSNQLPLLAFLAGNDFMSSDIEHFHDMLCPGHGSRGQDHIVNVVRYIKRMGWTGNPEDILEISTKLNIDESHLKEGLSYYDIEEPNGSEHEGTLFNMCSKCSIPASLFTLLSLRKYREGLSMADPEDEQLPPSAITYRLLRRRMYYLLYEGNAVEIEENCLYRLDSSTKQTESVRPLSLQIDEKIPPIDELLLGNVDQELRWKLFAVCMDLTISVEELQNVEPRFVSMCSILNILIKNERIDLQDWEIKSFFYQALYCHRADISQLKINEISSRAISLSGIFIRGVTNIINVIPVCGYPITFLEAMPWNYLEGEVFHYAYNKLKNNPKPDEMILEMCDNDRDIANQLHLLYRLTITGTRLDK